MSNFEFPKYDPESETACPIDYCREVMELAIENTEVSCVFAREGSIQIKKIIDDIQNNNAKSDDYDLLTDLLEVISKNTKCDIVKEASEICLKSLSEYEPEWDKHIKRGICKNLVCKGMYNLYIDPLTCSGTGECKKICPSILGSEGMIHVITTVEIDKEELIDVCPNKSIKKYGSIKPKTPLEPIPVGTFSSGEDDGGGRRRKKRRG